MMHLSIKTVLISSLIALLTLEILPASASTLPIPKKKRALLEQLIQMEAYGDALNELSELMPYYPNDAELLYMTATCYWNIASFKEQAIPTLKNALNNRPNKTLEVEILQRLINYQMSEEQYKDAAATYKELKTTMPDEYAEYHNNLDEKMQWATNMSNPAFAAAYKAKEAEKNNPRPAAVPEETPPLPDNTDNEVATASTTAANDPNDTKVIRQIEDKLAADIQEKSAPSVQKVESTPERSVKPLEGVTSDLGESNLPLLKRSAATNVNPNQMPLTIVKTTPDDKNEDTVTKTDGDQNLPEVTEDMYKKPTPEFIYAIQIFALTFPASKNYFKEKNSILVLKVGNYYKYYFNTYSLPEEAKAALPGIKEKYPDAFITKIDNSLRSELKKAN